VQSLVGPPIASLSLLISFSRSDSHPIENSAIELARHATRHSKSKPVDVRCQPTPLSKRHDLAPETEIESAVRDFLPRPSAPGTCATAGLGRPFLQHYYLSKHMLVLRLRAGLPSGDETIANQVPVVCMACSELLLVGACVLQSSRLQIPEHWGLAGRPFHPIRAVEILERSHCQSESGIRVDAIQSRSLCKGWAYLAFFCLSGQCARRRCVVLFLRIYCFRAISHV
jgi:hypothetical protein